MVTHVCHPSFKLKDDLVASSNYRRTYIEVPCVAIVDVKEEYNAYKGHQQ